MNFFALSLIVIKNKQKINVLRQGLALEVTNVKFF